MSLIENMPFPQQPSPLGYTVTTDPDEVDNDLHYSEEITALMEKTYHQVMKKKPHLIPHLLKLIEKYPNVPAFKNYLSSYYLMSGKSNKAYEINHRIVKEHPQYLHGKLMLASEFLDKKEFEEIPKVLGEELDLQALCPHRKVFHFSEFMPFLQISCRYLIETGNLEEAEKRIEQAEEMLEKDPVFDKLRMLILTKRVEKAKQNFNEMDEGLGEPFPARSHDVSIQTDEKPVFLHPEVEALYLHDLPGIIPIYQKILALPRETLLQDLETMLWDSMRRYEYFTGQDEYDEELMTFPLHALFLLAELKATEKLPLVLDLLRQGNDFLHFWFSDHIYETLWHFIYRLGERQLDVLKAFQFEQKIYYAGKAVVSQAVSQIALHQPERREEITGFYRDVFTYFLEHLDDEKLINPEAISPMICDVVVFHPNDLLPLIERFYEEDLVDLDLAGDYADLAKDILSPPKPQDVHAIFETSFDHVQHIVNTWYGYKPEEKVEPAELKMGSLDKSAEPSRLPSGASNLQPAASAKSNVPKVGRNEPCPCGSGRKYKHCCGKGK